MAGNLEILAYHEFLMSSHHTDSEVALATFALDLHEGTGLRVLVGGLGLGYTARAALASPRVAEVHVIELFPEVVGWLDEGLLPLSTALRQDNRFDTEVGDFFEYVEAPAGTPYDLILDDIDHAPDQRLAHGTVRFYETDGVRALARHLAPAGCSPSGPRPTARRTWRRCGAHSATSARKR